MVSYSEGRQLNDVREHGVEDNKGKEVTGGWKNPNGEELQNVNSSPQIVRVTRTKKMRWAGHVARLREKRRAQSLLRDNLKNRDHMED